MSFRLGFVLGNACFLPTSRGPRPALPELLTAADQLIMILNWQQLDVAFPERSSEQQGCVRRLWVRNVMFVHVKGLSEPRLWADSSVWPVFVARQSFQDWVISVASLTCHTFFFHSTFYGKDICYNFLMVVHLTQTESLNSSGKLCRYLSELVPVPVTSMIIIIKNMCNTDLKYFT